MANHATHFAAAGLASLISHFGEPVTYTPSGGAGKPISALVNRNPFDRQFDTDGEGERREIDISIYTDSVNGVASPAINDTVTLASEVWTVARIMEGTGAGAHKLRLTRYDRDEIAVREHRLRRQ